MLFLGKNEFLPVTESEVEAEAKEMTESEVKTEETSESRSCVESEDDDVKLVVTLVYLAFNDARKDYEATRCCGESFDDWYKKKIEKMVEIYKSEMKKDVTKEENNGAAYWLSGV